MLNILQSRPRIKQFKVEYYSNIRYSNIFILLLLSSGQLYIYIIAYHILIKWDWITTHLTPLPNPCCAPPPITTLVSFSIIARSIAFGHNLELYQNWSRRDARATTTRRMPTAADCSTVGRNQCIIIIAFSICFMSILNKARHSHSANYSLHTGRVKDHHTMDKIRKLQKL